MCPHALLVTLSRVSSARPPTTAVYSVYRIELCATGFPIAAAATEPCKRVHTHRKLTQAKSIPGRRKRRPFFIYLHVRGREREGEYGVVARKRGALIFGDVYHLTRAEATGVLYQSVSELTHYCPSPSLQEESVGEKENMDALLRSR